MVVDKILITVGCVMDGLGDIAASYYLAKNLLTRYDVTMLLYFLEPKNREQSAVLWNSKRYAENIDTAGYVTISGEYHKFDNNFILHFSEHEGSMKELSKIYDNGHTYFLRLYGIAFEFSNIFPIRNIPSFRFNEFTLPPDEYSNYIITGGLGPRTDGIYFDREMRELSQYYSNNKVEFLKKYCDVIGYVFPDTNLSDIDIYMAYGREPYLTKLYVKLASRLSNGKKMMIFTNGNLYIEERKDKYESITDKFYIKGNKLFVVGTLIESDFKKVILLSNKIVHCTGNSSVSQVLSANKIPIFDYLAHAKYFGNQLYNIMIFFGISFATILKKNVYDKLHTGLPRIDDFIDEAHNSLLTDKPDNFFKYIEDECQFMQNVFNKLDVFKQYVIEENKIQ